MPYPTDPQDTPALAYKADGEEISETEKNNFITSLGGALSTDLDSINVEISEVSDVADSAKYSALAANLDANAAQDTANSAETTANNAISKDGNVSVDDVKTFTSFPVLSASTAPTGSQSARASDIALVQTDTLGGIKMKKITFSGWDMTNVTGIDIAHGIADSTKIIGVVTSIYSSQVSLRREITHMEESDTKAGGNWVSTGTYIALKVFSGQHWDSSLYSNASGTVVIFYID